MALLEMPTGGLSAIKRAAKKVLPAFAQKKIKSFVQQRKGKQILQTQINPYEPGRYPEGINLIGPIDGATGLGQSCRLLERVVAQLDVPYQIINYNPNAVYHEDITGYRDEMGTELKYDINLWHVNPSIFPNAFNDFGKSAFDGRYNIAYWLWELEDFPDEWVPYIHLLDEVWTPSEFISKSIRKKTSKPVCTVPYHVTAATDMEHYNRKYFGLPEDKFLFLMMYDSQSIKERKNPEGIMKAFQMAFSPEEENVGLVIKVNSAEKKELDSIRNQMGTYNNMYFITDNLEKIQVNSLIACVDVFVSLHRAEGFGLVMAEAMLNKTPVIGTNWSANTEFMNSDVACMVKYKMKKLDHDILPYKKGNEWAEPDLEDAAGYMKRLYEDKIFYNELSQKAYHYVCKKLGMEAAEQVLCEQIARIREGISLGN